MQGLDWSRTSIGPVTAWPQSLKHYVRLILEMPTPAIIFWGPEQVQLYNEGYATIMGPRHPTYLGASYRDCWPETYPVIFPWMQRVLAGEVVQVTNTHFALTRHGAPEEAFFTFTFSPIRDDDDRIAGIFQPVVEVTESVLAERRTETLRAVARECAGDGTTADAVAALRANTKDLPFALVYLRDGQSEELTSFGHTGLDASFSVGRSAPALLRRVFQSDESEVVDDVPSLLGRVHVGPWPEPTEAAFVLPIRRARGDPVRGVIAFGLSPRLRFDGKYREFLEAVARELALHLDAEHARRAEEEFLARERAARREAERANAAKDEFLAMLGHELRNPLAPILTALHVMRMRGSTDWERERSIMERQAKHMVRLVDDLLDVARITSGRIELTRTPTELSCAIARAVELTSPLLQERGHALEMEVPPVGLLIDGDEVRLAQVFCNLLRNAAMYTDRGGRIMITARRAGDQVECRVRDEGSGIDAAILPSIFDMFFQPRQTIERRQGGLGLGLTIVRNLVRLHGGTVSARSDGRGHGSEFLVQLPASASVRPGREGERSGADGDEGSATERRRILIVDDNVDASELLAAWLQDRGHTTRVAHDAPAALRVVEGFLPDAALLDIGLPAMDGYELARRMRAMPGLEKAALVAVTGYGQETDRQRAHEAGFDAHFTKPVDPSELEAVILSLTRERGLRCKHDGGS